MTKKLLPAILVSLFAIASCTKTARVEPTPTPIDSTIYYTYSMSSIYNSLKVVPKTVVMNPATGGTFVGNSGTIYTFPANAFQTASGGAVTGNINIDLAEYLKRGDMIFSRVLPVSDGNALVSAGELQITAYQGGTKLIMKPGYTFTAVVPQLGAISTGMQFFYGQTVNTSVNPVNWHPSATWGGAGTTTYLGDTISIQSDSIGLVSAGRFLSSPNYQTFSLTIDGPQFDDSDHVQAYALFDNNRVAYPMTARYHQKISETHVPNVPLHFVVWGIYHGDFYGGISSGVTPQNGWAYTMSIVKVNPITFLAQVNAL